VCSTMAVSSGQPVERPRNPPERTLRFETRPLVAARRGTRSGSPKRAAPARGADLKAQVGAQDTLAHLIFAAMGFGFVTASVLAIASVGVTLQFGVTNYVNFAYGDYLTLGAYLAWTANFVLHLPFWVSAILATALMGVIAVAISLVVLRPFVQRRASLLYLLIVTFGLSLIIANIVQAIWGVNLQQYNIPGQQAVTLGPFLLTSDQLLIIVIAIASMVAIHLLLTRTKLGKGMRAMSDNKDLARVSGIDTERITIWTWFISGSLAGLAGVMLALSSAGLEPTLGEGFLFVIFSAVILGGVGHPYGAMIGAVIIGLVTEMSAVWINSAYKSDIAFAVLIVMILVRPQGLIPTRGKA
jgi:branched-subunit amino acid ABC-type transport system permease component